MSHHIYQTKAFVIDSMDVGEANKLLTLFTSDLGLIFASAQSVRVLKSKLRPSIQDLSFSKIALVRGKEYWRLTSAEKLISLHDKRVPIAVRRFMAKTLEFIKRFVAGESKHQEVFDMLTSLYAFCFAESKKIAIDDNQLLKVLAPLVEYRALSLLGYGSDKKEFIHIKNHEEWSVDLLEKIGKDTDLLLAMKKHIEMALQSSHL